MNPKAWIGTVLLVISLAPIRAQRFEDVKTWTFSLPHGSLRISLKSSGDGLSSLAIGPNGQIPEAPIAEQIEPLNSVLAQMPSLGLDPHKVAYIGTRIFTQDVLQKLAYACADSPAWRLSMQKGGRGKEGLVVALLNQSGAYAPYNEVFGRYGIRAQVSAAEMVGLMPFSSVPPRDSRDRANAKLLVPADAMLGMRFSRFDSGSD